MALRIAASRSVPGASPLRLLLRLAALALVFLAGVYYREVGRSVAGDGARAAATLSAAVDATASTAEPAAAALGAADIQRRCAGTLGSWCRGYLAQAPVPAAPPPRFNRSCLWGPPGTCNFVGQCDHHSGTCRCPAGWAGDDCSTRQRRPCSERHRTHGFEPHEGGSNRPLALDGHIGMYGHCAGVCDEDTGHCFCRNGTKFARVPPDPRDPPGTPPVEVGRPMSWHCQPSKDDAGKRISFGDKEPGDLWGAQGWCNAEQPAMKEPCPCILEGRAGPFCDLAAESFCPNQCNGHGECNMGFCKCHDGWWGQDCAQRTGDTPWSPGLESERPWLEPHVRTPVARDPAPGATRRRPLVYVYELPAMYNAVMLQYRPDRGTCVHRFFVEGNQTLWNDNWAYMAETGLHESLLQSEHRTLDPEEADFFYLPIYSSCYLYPIDASHDFPYFHSSHTIPRVHGTVNMLIEAWQWVRTHHPYWDRHGGRDHIVLQSHDEGSCWLPAVLRPAIVLTHWGRTDRRHVSNTGYTPDDYSKQTGHPLYMPEGTRGKLGDFPCYDPEKDLVVPPMASALKYSQSPLLGAPTPNRTRFFAFFKGRTQQNNPRYSRGIRQELENLCRNGSWPAKHNIHIGEGMPDVSPPPASYSEALASSLFCLALPGDGWSPRLEDAVLHGCIPVIIQDGVHLAFEPLLDYGAFSVRVAQADMARLPQLLAAIPPDRVAALRVGVAAVWRRFAWTGHHALGQLQRGFMDQYAEHARRQREEADGQAAGGDGGGGGGDGAASAEGKARDGTPPAEGGDAEGWRLDEGDALETVFAWLHSRMPHVRQPSGGGDDGGGGTEAQRPTAGGGGGAGGGARDPAGGG